MLTAADPNTEWRECFAAYAPRLVLFARQWLPDRADAEDAVQDGFVRFWRKCPAFDGNQTGLLFAAVRTAALDQIRRERRRRGREQAVVDTDEFTDSPLPIRESIFASGSDTQPVETALGQLPIEQREVLVLKIWSELTFAQIAEALSIPLNTAASRYRYAITALRKTLQPALP